MLSYASNLIKRWPVRRCVRLYRRRRGGLSSSHIPTITKAIGKPEESERSERSSRSNSKTASKLVEVDTAKETEDMLIRYFEHVNTGFKKSMKALTNLKRELKELDGTDRKMEAIFKFLTEEASLEINRLNNLGPEKVKEIIENSQINKLNNVQANSEEQLESVILDELFLTNEHGATSAELANTEMLVDILSHMSKHTWEENSKLVTLEQMAEIFELSKQIPDFLLRRRALYFSAKILYDSKKVRMDPINESFYIDTLVFFGKYNEALKLFNSNKSKVNQRWWNDLGMMITLRAKHIGAFGQLLNETDTKFGDGTYLHPNLIRIAIKRYLSIRNYTRANDMTERFIKMIEMYGISNKVGNSDIVHFQSEEDADNYLNEIELPTTDDILITINHHIHWKNIEKAYDLLACYLITAHDVDPEYKLCASKLKLILLKDLNELETALSKRIEHNRCKQIIKDLDKVVLKEKQTLRLDNRVTSHFLYEELIKLGDKKRSDVEKLLQYNRSDVPDQQSESTDISANKKGVYYNVLKLLLANGEEEKAYFVLEVLENMNNDGNVAASHDYILNSFHYSIFIEYYQNKLLTSRKKTIYEEKVSEIIARINKHNIAPSDVLWSKLIAYYRTANNLDAAYNIINNLLVREKLDLENQENGQPIPLFDKKVLDIRLYIEIWITYAKYYQLVLPVSYKKKSNTKAFSYVTKRILEKISNNPIFTARELFFQMIDKDNVIPSPHLYIRIMKVFLKQNDLEALLATIVSMTYRHEYELSSSVQKYILTGLDMQFHQIKKSKGQINSNELTPLVIANELRTLKENGKMIDLKKSGNCSTKDIIEEIKYLISQKYGEQDFMEQIRKAFHEMGVNLPQDI